MELNTTRYKHSQTSHTSFTKVQITEIISIEATLAAKKKSGILVIKINKELFFFIIKRKITETLKY